MSAILHKIDIEVPTEKAYQALNTTQGLSHWWTKSSVDNNDFSFYFGSEDNPPVKMRVIEEQINKKLVWKCIEGPWKDYLFIFEIENTEKGTTLRFYNTGWVDADDFFMHCNCKWGFFLGVSLKNYLEKGQGTPHPNEPKI
jgi:uncharacterized protein YndB with AHSA1/START domain